MEAPSTRPDADHIGPGRKDFLLAPTLLGSLDQSAIGPRRGRGGPNLQRLVRSLRISQPEDGRTTARMTKPLHPRWLVAVSLSVLGVLGVVLRRPGTEIDQTRANLPFAESETQARPDELCAGFASLAYRQLYGPAFARKREWVKDEYRKLNSDGMEAASAGLHLLQPKEDHPRDPFIESDSLGWGRYNFFCVIPAQSDTPYSECPWTGGDRGPWASVQRALESYDLSMARVAPDPAGDGFSVEIAFGAAGIDRLSSLLGPLNTSEHGFNWLGRSRLPRDPRPAVEIVIVMDNVGYLPISVEPFVERHQVDLPLVVATRLPRELAMTMVLRLGF